MSQIMLLGYSYSLIILFFWLLFLCLSVAQRMRQVRLLREELGILPPPSENIAMKHVLAYIQSPLDEMRAWNGSRSYTTNADNLPSIPSSERIPGPIVLPMRYRQTLLFGDDLAETRPNPVTSQLKTQ